MGHRRPSLGGDQRHRTRHAVEARTCEEILKVIEDVLPDLFRSNGLERGEGKVSVVFDTRVETIHMAAA